MSFHVTPRRARVIGALASIVAAGALAAPGASLAAGIPGPPGDPLPDGAVPDSAGPGGLHHAAPSVGSVTFHRGAAHLVLPGTGPTSGRAGGLTGGKVGMPTDDGTGPNNPVADDDGNGGTAPSDGNGNGNGNGDGSGSGDGSGNGSGGDGGGDETHGGGTSAGGGARGPHAQGAAAPGGGEPVPGSTPDVIASPPPDTRKASEQVTEAMKTIVDYAYKARTGDVTAED